MERIDETLICKCGNKMPYKPLEANYVLICPQCKKDWMLECDYGFGPVQPCGIYLGANKIIGRVFEKDRKCYLKSVFLPEMTRLEKTYLDAIYEAMEIIDKELNS